MGRRRLAVLVAGLGAVLVVGLYAGHDQGLRVPAPRTAAPVSAITTYPYWPNGAFTTGPDGTLWFTPGYTGDELGHVDAAGRLLTVPVTGTRHRADLIAVAPNHTVWALDRGNAAVLRLGESGRATAYTVPHARSNLCTTTIGPDSSLWFLESEGSCTNRILGPQKGRNWIGHVGQDGRIQEYPLPAGRYLCDQLIGPDGAFWFLEARLACGSIFTTNAEPSWVGRIGADGRIRRYPLPKGSMPVTLQAGGDGALWLADEQGRKFWRITLSGRLSIFSLSADDNSYTPRHGLTLGPDGNMWFMAPGFLSSAHVGRITPAGAIRMFPMPDDLESGDRLFAGRCDDLWILEREGTIGHVTTSGAVFEDSTGAAPDYLEGIAVGLDGSGWYGIGGSSEIGQITPSGVVTKHAYLPATGSTSDLAFDPAGNLWVADEGLQAAVRVSLPGRVSSVLVPGAMGGLGAVAAGRDRSLWFLDVAGNAIGRRSPNGSVVEFRVPTANSGPRGLTVGPGNNVWFTEYLAGRIGRTAADGTIVEYPLPQKAGRPSGITMGADGNLWFTESGTNRIGRITPGGRIVEFPTGMVGGQPTGIVAGPDGNLWFTDDLGGRIGRITPAGQVTSFALASATANPFQIVASPDGNLWFTEYGANKIGRITTRGVSREFAVPTANSYPNGIAVGSDGALWFTERDTGAVGRISTSGAITEYPIANLGQPEGIATVGSELWLSEGSGNWLTRIVDGSAGHGGAGQGQGGACG